MMKKRTVKKAVAAIISLSIMCSLAVTADAHSSNLHGVVKGSEDAGWKINENLHIGGTSITYNFTTSVSEARKQITREGGQWWSSVVTIKQVQNSTPIGTVTVATNLYSTVLANTATTSNAADGHLISWKISMNDNHTITKQVMAHEFGHVIGLPRH